MRHSWRVVRASWQLWLKASTVFRANMLIGVGVSLAWLFFAIAPVLAAGRYLGEGDGWTQARLLFLQAAWYWMDGVMWIFILGNIAVLQEDVHEGRLESKLLMPADSLSL